MNLNKYLVRVFIKGGIVSPRFMLKIMSVAKKMGNEHIYFGSKQDILFYADKKDIEYVESKLDDIRLILNKDFIGIERNITSSYPAFDILPSTSWISSGTYKDIFEGFNYIPRLSINIVDPVQNLVPLFYGELNFVASKKENYWHLFVNLRFSDVQLEWPGLIFSKDIPRLAKEIEEIVHAYPEIPVELVVDYVTSRNNFYFMGHEMELKFSEGFFPYYEGINPMLNGDNLWAGFYWKNNAYDITFLESIARLCLKTNVQNVCITPWKSFLVKNIKKEDVLKWQQIIGQYGINMRHSSFELNWHLPLLSKRALKLKSFITGELNKIDIRTYGLTFSIDTTIADKFTSIVIVERPLFKMFGNYHVINRYDIFYAKNFNANSGEYIQYSTVYEKADIIVKLVELSREFFVKLTVPKVKLNIKKNKAVAKEYHLYQCEHCLTVYDEEAGDEYNKIKPKTAFINLPDSFKCPTCDGKKSDFELITGRVDKLSTKVKG